MIWLLYDMYYLVVWLLYLLLYFMLILMYDCCWLLLIVDWLLYLRIIWWRHCILSSFDWCHLCIFVCNWCHVVVVGNYEVFAVFNFDDWCYVNDVDCWYWLLLLFCSYWWLQFWCYLLLMYVIDVFYFCIDVWLLLLNNYAVIL